MSAVATEITVGMRCIVKGKATGTVRFGPDEARFGPGQWVGIELDEPRGINNGMANGTRYFQCRERHGLFTRAANLKLVTELLSLRVKGLHLPPMIPTETLQLIFQDLILPG